MPIELKMLAWSVALGLAHVLLGAALTTRQRGLRWRRRLAIGCVSF